MSEFNTPEKSDLNRAVMRRVWMVYCMRRVLASEKLKAAVLASCCVSAIFLVSVPHVIQNLMRVSGLVAEAAYLYAAFLNTSFQVEIIVVVAVGATALLVWDIGRNIGGSVRSGAMRFPHLFMRDRTSA